LPILKASRKNASMTDAHDDMLKDDFDDGFFSPKGPGLPPLDCVGCGWCCLDNPCEVSHQAFGYLPRCPALVWIGARYVCDLVIHPREGVDLSPLFVGQGCCARDNAWRACVRERE